MSRSFIDLDFLLCRSHSLLSWQLTQVHSVWRALKVWSLSVDRGLTHTNYSPFLVLCWFERAAIFFITQKRGFSSLLGVLWIWSGEWTHIVDFNRIKMRNKESDLSGDARWGKRNRKENCDATIGREDGRLTERSTGSMFVITVAKGYPVAVICEIHS